MDLHDRRNVNRIIRLLAREWKCPVWAAKIIVQKAINDSWEKAMFHPEIKVILDQYFPNGKPTVAEYILFQGHKFEGGEEMPDILSL